MDRQTWHLHASDNGPNYCLQRVEKMNRSNGTKPALPRMIPDAEQDREDEIKMRRTGSNGEYFSVLREFVCPECLLIYTFMVANKMTSFGAARRLLAVINRGKK